MKSKLSLIAVVGKHRELGKDNHLLWKIPGDLPRFKKITYGHPVIMGRKTHSTFQYNGGPLPGRTNIVITRNPEFHPEGFIAAHSLPEAIEIAEGSPGNEEIFIIGGGEIYRQAIEQADRLYLTEVQATADADTFFPEYSVFTNVISEERPAATEVPFRYVVLER